MTSQTSAPHSCSGGSVESVRSSRTSRTGRQFIQLFSCQRCRKKRKRKQQSTTTHPESRFDNEGTPRDDQLKIIDEASEHRTENRSGLSTGQASNKIEDIKRQLFLSTSPDRGRSKLVRDRVDNRDYLRVASGSGLTKASILKNKNSPSPEKFSDLSPAQTFDTDGERLTASSILVRSAKLKNESGYGSFSFQHHELRLLFHSATPPPDGGAGSDIEIGDGSGLSLNRKSMTSDSGGSASSLCIPAKRNREATSSGRRARFNEAVDVIFDDRRSGRPMVKDCVKLKQSPDDRELSPLEIKMINSGETMRTNSDEINQGTDNASGDFFRNRAGSDCGLNSSFLMSAKGGSCRRAQKKALGEARMEIERLALDSSSTACEYYFFILLTRLMKQRPVLRSRVHTPLSGIRRRCC